MTDAELTQHPLSAAFPAMNDAAFGELRADIAQNGLHHPIIVFEEQVLDGWHRYRACREVGIAVRSHLFEGDEAAARKFVVSTNLMRRHLDASQRGMIAARFAQITKGGDRRSDQTAKLPTETTVSEAAEMLNVSTKTVGDARTVLASGDAELIEKVERGEQSVSSAAKETRQSRPRAAPRPRAAAPPTPIEIVPATVAEWASLPKEDQAAYLAHRNPQASLNQQKTGEDDNLIDWAKWTWNPITGCLHNCPYCYARDIAERFSGTPAYPNGFEPTFRSRRCSMSCAPHHNGSS
jgi:hypothetical protein